MTSTSLRWLSQIIFSNSLRHLWISHNYISIIIFWRAFLNRLRHFRPRLSDNCISIIISWRIFSNYLRHFAPRLSDNCISIIISWITSIPLRHFVPRLSDNCISIIISWRIFSNSLRHFVPRLSDNYIYIIISWITSIPLRHLWPCPSDNYICHLWQRLSENWYLFIFFWDEVPNFMIIIYHKYFEVPKLFWKLYWNIDMICMLKLTCPSCTPNRAIPWETSLVYNLGTWTPGTQVVIIAIYNLPIFILHKTFLLQDNIKKRGTKV